MRNTPKEQKISALPPTSDIARQRLNGDGRACGVISEMQVVSRYAIARGRPIVAIGHWDAVAPACSQHASAILPTIQRRGKELTPRGRQLDQPYGKHFAKRSLRSV